jgi:4-amino-4-deoxy-L-arabinose transferase-like glycosyltransferase
MKDLLSNRNLYIGVALVLLSALALVIVDGRTPSVQGWFAYLVILGAGAALIVVVWRWFQPESPPRFVLIAAITAMVIRVLVGLVFIRALPVYGYDRNAQNAGYVYFDAYKRDTDAWARAKSERPLLNAFTSPKVSDQYGGYLFISASVYRYLSPDAHRPLIVTSIGASIAGLGVLLGWLFISQIFGRKAARIGAWLLALYPEAVLLGASQMREPFLITALAGGLAAYALWMNGHNRRSLLLAFVILFILTLPISPPFVLVLLVTVGLGWLWERRMNLRRTLPVLALAVCLGFLSVYFAARSWSALEGFSGSMWQIIMRWWEHTGGSWRVNLVTDQSLNLDVLLLRMPTWLHIPFLVLFGLAQPFLPAAIVAPGATIWRVIGIFRSLGWFLVLPFLVYAPIYAIRKGGWRHLATYLSFYVWVTALIASYRAPSYQWDNPRYRVVYLVIQVALIGWLWVKRSDERDPWVVRLAWSILGFCLIVTHWYIGRFFPLPSLSLPVTMILAVAVGISIPIMGMISDYLRARKLAESSLEV